MKTFTPMAGRTALAALLAAAVFPAQAQASDAFGAALARAYEGLAALERAQGDHRDADTYAARASAASAGNPPPPDDPVLRAAFLDDAYVSPLSNARTRLVAAFDEGGREAAPDAAARAQSSYDCWLEQAAEDLQPDHISACKDAFERAVAQVEAALVPPPPPPPAPPADSDGDGVLDPDDDCPGTPAGTPVDERGCPEIPDLQGVHFGHDKATLTAAAKAELDEVAATIAGNPGIRVEIVGHTDSQGSDEYNRGLSERRAASTRDYLVSRGIDSARLSTAGRGESEPVADNGTAEGRRANRRVELTARPR